LINTNYHTERSNCRKEIEKAKFDSAIFFCKNFRRYLKKDRVKKIECEKI